MRSVSIIIARCSPEMFDARVNTFIGDIQNNGKERVVDFTFFETELTELTPEGWWVTFKVEEMKYVAVREEE